MIEIKGDFNTAIVFTDELEKTAQDQIRTLCDQEEFKDSKIRVMPDVHAGKGCTIGTTMTIHDKIVPNLVGVDIGCGIETIELEEKNIDFYKLDNIIRQNIPAGRDIRRTFHSFSEEIDLSALACAKDVNIDRGYKSIGTLGGGNHFIEIDKSEDGRLFLLIHSGSRHIGLEVATVYQKKAYDSLSKDFREKYDNELSLLKARGSKKDINRKLKAFKEEERQNLKLPKDLSYLTGKLFDDYLQDMKIIQEFAALNRKAMVDVILEEMGLTRLDSFTTTHNYIDIDEKIHRKGAVSANRGERFLIPINMKDGSLICLGKGNTDWNKSAPPRSGADYEPNDCIKRA